jgi:alkylation response protein AidB-like acyl-CoA dehydrogenase
MTTTTVSRWTPEAEHKLIEDAARVGQLALAEIEEAERNAEFSQEVIRTMVDAGFHHMLLPRRYGGMVSMRTYEQVLRTVAYYNMSAAWLCYFWAIHPIWVAYMRNEAADLILSEDKLIADIFAAQGRLERDGTGWRLFGEWKFGSGAIYAEWIGLGALAQLPGWSEPGPVFAVVRTRDVEIVRDWDALGLRATASHGVRADGVFVPDEFILPFLWFMIDPRTHPELVDRGDPLFRVPFIPLFVAGFAPIIATAARRMVDLLREYTERRIRVIQGGVVEREQGRSHRLLGNLYSRLDMVDALVDRYFRKLEELIERGENPISEQERSQMFAWRAQVIRESTLVAYEAFNFMGGMAVYKSHPAERLLRDIMTFAAHPAQMFEDALSAYGRTILGLPSGHIL